MEIDLGAPIVMKVTYKGSVYEITEPTVEQIEFLQESDEGEKSNKAMLDLLCSLGMPMEVMKSMPVRQFKLFAEKVAEVILPK
jgi:hypothetical protein